MGGKTLGELLVDLRDVEGVRGCALSTNDGIIVRSELNGRFRDDVVSGLASSHAVRSISPFTHPSST